MSGGRIATVMREHQRVAAVARAAHGHGAADREQGHGAGQPEREREHAAGLRQLGQIRDVLDLDGVVVQPAGQVRHGAGALYWMLVPASSMVTVNVGFA